MSRCFLVTLLSFIFTLAGATTPACPEGANAPIHEHAFVPIRGIEQWVTIDGEHCGNPVILFVHGGPGNPLSPFADALFGDWQKDFTLVQWDQRGAGRTYTRNNPHEDLTVRGMADDGVAVAEHVLTRLGKSKLILWGSSWGTVLALNMAASRSDLFHAYMGVSHMVGQRQNEAASFAATLTLARAANDRDALAALESMGPPPWTNPRHLGALRRVTRKYEAMVSDAAPKQWWQAEQGPDFDESEAYAWLQFVGMHGDGMFRTVDMERDVQRLDLPVFIVQGEADLVTHPAVTRRWFDALNAPEKQFTVVARAGHDPNLPMLEAQWLLLKSRRWE
ncbi:alpha/beta hydrolase [Burkholderiaceae bacterium DAT-1]|nr:alpha/beta hydrolase [Burkholderiaceae bacterium DAT-1]